MLADFHWLRPAWLLAIPLVVRYGIDSAMLGSAQDASLLAGAVAIFVAVIAVNYGATWIQDRMIAITGERVLFDMRRAMFAHLQHVALSFMDKTEVGRMMSRLQGDVNALQEFLENSITVIGDLVLLFTDDAERLHSRIRAAGVPATLQAARPGGLEDVFLRLTGRHLRD